jgi:hypothetical protein
LLVTACRASPHEIGERDDPEVAPLIIADWQPVGTARRHRRKRLAERGVERKGLALAGRRRSATLRTDKSLSPRP